MSPPLSSDLGLVDDWAVQDSDPCSACGFGHHDEEGFCVRTPRGKHVAKDGTLHERAFDLCDREGCPRG